MSTCIHNHEPEWKPDPNAVSSVGVNPSRFAMMYSSSPPHNPVQGSMYFDTRQHCVKVFNNGMWVEQDRLFGIADTFDIILNDGEFVKFRVIFENEKYDTDILDSKEKERICIGLENCLKYIEERITDRGIILAIQKRIFDKMG